MRNTETMEDRNHAVERLINLSEAAEFLHIDPDTLRTLTRRCRVPSMKIGRQWRFDLELPREWIQEQSRERVNRQEAPRHDRPE